MRKVLKWLWFWNGFYLLLLSSVTVLTIKGHMEWFWLLCGAMSWTHHIKDKKVDRLKTTLAWTHHIKDKKVDRLKTTLACIALDLLTLKLYSNKPIEVEKGIDKVRNQINEALL